MTQAFLHIYFCTLCCTSRVSNWRPVDCCRALERLRHWQRAKLVELHLSGICRTNAALVEGKRDEERDLAHQQGTAKLDGTGGEAVRMWVHSGRLRPPRLRAAKATPYAAELLLFSLSLSMYVALTYIPGGAGGLLTGFALLAYWEKRERSLSQCM